MVVENVLITMDLSGNGNFHTGHVVPDKWTKYDFVIKAKKVTPHSFVGGDFINKIAENTWEGYVEDVKGAVRLDFEGMSALDIEKNPDSETDIRFIVNDKNMGIRNSIYVTPPMPLWHIGGAILAGLIGTGVVIAKRA